MLSKKSRRSAWLWCGKPRSCAGRLAIEDMARLIGQAYPLLDWRCWPPSRACAGANWSACAEENIDLDTCQIRIVETTAELDRGGMLPETPKSKAGRRTVSFPSKLVPELRWHLERFSQLGERGRVFVGPKGAPLRRSNFRPIWNDAGARAGIPDLHFHDLRHVGGSLAAATSASLRELMALWPFVYSRRADLPARDQRPGSDHRQGPWWPGATGPAKWPG
jgi:hypothetical protein